VDAARFANQGPTVVASPDRCGVGAVVCAAIIAARQGLSSSMALHEVEKRCGPLRVEIDDEEELDTFCHRLLLAEFDLRLGVLSTPTSTLTQAWDAVHLRLGVPSTPRPDTNASQNSALSPVKRGASAHEASAPDGSKGEVESKRKARKQGTPQTTLDGWKLA